MKKAQEPKIQLLKDFVESYSSLVTMSAMRKWILESEENGANMWVRRLGRKIAVDVDKFFEWTKRKR